MKRLVKCSKCDQYVGRMKIKGRWAVDEHNDPEYGVMCPGAATACGRTC